MRNAPMWCSLCDSKSNSSLTAKMLFGFIVWLKGRSASEWTPTVIKSQLKSWPPGNDSVYHQTGVEICRVSHAHKKIILRSFLIPVIDHWIIAYGWIMLKSFSGCTNGLWLPSAVSFTLNAVSVFHVAVLGLPCNIWGSILAVWEANCAYYREGLFREPIIMFPVMHCPKSKMLLRVLVWCSLQLVECSSSNNLTLNKAVTLVLLQNRSVLKVFLFKIFFSCSPWFLCSTKRLIVDVIRFQPGETLTEILETSATSEQVRCCLSMLVLD